jgi:NADPH-dependent 2,4-dienoyl-CoA reductase/sulfur reductase-like enzyme
VLVVGGGLGGVAAALAAAEGGAEVGVAEAGRWLGGQLTSQAVPVDEHPWVERFGVTARYRRLRDGIRAYYREHYPLTAAARARPHLNPGTSRVGAL